MPGQFGWTAASLVPPHQVAAALSVPTSTATSGPGTQTFTPAQVPALDVSSNTNVILQRILGPNFSLGLNPSPIAGSDALYSPNYLAQAQAGTLPAANNPAAPGFTQFGNSFWKMPPSAPASSTPLAYNENAPAATSSGAPSAWVANQGNLFNI